MFFLLNKYKIFIFFLFFIVFIVMGGSKNMDILGESKNMNNFEYTLNYPVNIDLDNNNYIKINTFTLKDDKVNSVNNVDVKFIYNNREIFKTKTNNGYALFNLNKENLKLNEKELKDNYLELICKIGDNEEKLSFNLVKDYKVLIITDKPIYQPGQKIFIKLIALKSIQNKYKPIKDNFILEITDPKGNKLEYKSIQTDTYGTFFYEYNLSNLINLGVYKIKLIKDGKVLNTINFEVQKYTLPKFKIELKNAPNYLVINKQYDLSLELSYFFGKKVNDAKVDIDVYSFDAEFYKINSYSGKTDKNGTFKFKLKLPDYLTGVDKNKGLIKISIKAEDTANQIETKDFIFNVYSKEVLSDMVPTNPIVKNKENKFLLICYRPEGEESKDSNYKIVFHKPFNKTFILNKNTFKFDYLVVDDYIEFKYEVIDLNNNLKESFSYSFYTNENINDYIFLDLEKVLYKVGDKVNLDVITNDKKQVYIETYLKTNSGFISLLSDTIEVNKKTNYSFTLKDKGNIIIRAYFIDNKGNIVDNIKSIIVNESDSNYLILANFDKEIYKPKDKMKLKINTVLNGKEEDSKVLVDIVDEAVLYLANKTPELLKLYLSLVDELLTPKYEVHNYKDLIIKNQNDILNYALLKDYNNLISENFGSENKVVNSIEIKYEKTLKNAQIIYQKAYNYYTQYNTIPNILDLDKSNAYDGWNRLFKLVLKNGVIKVISSGPDGKFDTKDDIVYPYYYKRKERIFFDDVVKSPGIMFEKSLSEPSVSNLKPEFKKDNLDSNFSIREYFPETFYSNIIDSNKDLVLTLPDSITNWKVSLLAVNKEGNIANKVLDLKVFQEFFIDVNLPLFLTKNDEVSIPVIVYNYTNKLLKVSLKIKKEDWFELLDDDQKSIEINKNEVKKVYFKIKVVKVGKNYITIFASSANFKDAIKKECNVVPEGIFTKDSKSFSGNNSFSFSIEGEGKGAYVVVYPVLFSQVLSGLDNLLQMPYGCFEQTSSVNYPNVLILKYLNIKNITNPSIRMKANYYISIGYQRLLTFEVEGGGFSWFGDKPANKVLTAFGIKEFKDMKDVIFVDKDLIERTKIFLLNNQLSDGSWEPDKNYLHQEAWQNIQQSKLTTTAYILDALLENDKDIINNKKINLAFNYLIKNTQNLKDIDNYTLSFIFSSFVNYLSNLGDYSKIENSFIDNFLKIKKEILKRLKGNDEGLYLEGPKVSLFYGDYNTSSIETTANVCISFTKLSKINLGKIRDNNEIEIAYKMIKYLIKNKSDSGLWYSTQPTIMSLKAIYLFDLLSTISNTNKKATLVINEKEKINIEFSKDDLAYKIIDITDYLKDGQNTIKVNGDNLFYDLVYYQYIKEPVLVYNNQKLLDINVSYDRTKVKENDRIKVNVKITNLSKRVLNMVVVDLGIPPGFSVITDNLDNLKKSGFIKNYELTYNQIIVYFDKIEKDIEFSYEIRANYPLKVNTGNYKVYEYYNPSNKIQKQGNILIVN
jgi:hypothetical protein